MVVDTASVVGAAFPDPTSVVDAIVDLSSDTTIDPNSDTTIDATMYFARI